MCTCASCSYTDSFSGWVAGEQGELLPDPNRGGFDRWPKGEPAGRRASAASYNAHVSHLWKGVSRTSTDYTRGAGAGWYGTPAGMTRAEVERVLRETFAKAQAEEAAQNVEKSPVSLLSLARELRQQRRQQRKEERVAA